MPSVQKQAESLQEAVDRGCALKCTTAFDVSAKAKLATEMIQEGGESAEFGKRLLESAFRDARQLRAEFDHHTISV